MTQQQVITPEMALQKLRKFCAYQERCHSQVIKKLSLLGIYGNQASQITATLIAENYLNEERFVKAFAGGKFRVKGWGKQKISNELKRLGISDKLIETALKQISTTDFDHKLEQLAEKKLKLLKDEPLLKKKKKLVDYLLYRGYGVSEVWQLVNKLLK